MAMDRFWRSSQLDCPKIKSQKAGRGGSQYHHQSRVRPAPPRQLPPDNNSLRQWCGERAHGVRNHSIHCTQHCRRIPTHSTPVLSSSTAHCRHLLIVYFKECWILKGFWLTLIICQFVIFVFYNRRSCLCDVSFFCNRQLPSSVHQPSATIIIMIIRVVELCLVSVLCSHQSYPRLHKHSVLQNQRLLLTAF